MRSLDTTRGKLWQFAYGVMENEARQPFRASDSGITVARQLMAAGAVQGLRHMFPVNATQSLRRDLFPVLSEVMVVAIRLSMTGDEQIAAAAERLGTAAGALIEHIDEPKRVWAKREEELQAAIGQLRRARNAANAPPWRRRKLRRAVTRV